MNWLTDCKLDTKDITEFLLKQLYENGMICCNELYEFIDTYGLITIRNNKLVLNHFIPKEIIEENMKRFPEADIKNYKTEEFDSGSKYITLTIPKCFSCFKEFNYLIPPIATKRDPGLDYRIKYLSIEDVSSQLTKYDFCCKELEDATKLGYFAILKNPGTKEYELLFNHFIFPQKAYNIITGEVYNPDSMFICSALTNCIYCNKVLVEPEEEDHGFFF